MSAQSKEQCVRWRRLNSRTNYTFRNAGPEQGECKCVGNLWLWPQGRSFCRGQSESFKLLLRSTYWHIQMPSVYCENRSIGWNNTVTGDNVPVRDDLWGSFGFTDSGASYAFPPPATAITITLQMQHPPPPPPPPHTSNVGNGLSFSPSRFLPPPRATSVLPPPFADFPIFSHSPHTFISFPYPAPFPPQRPAPHFIFFPPDCLASPPSSNPPPPPPNPLAACLRLIVSIFRSVVDISHLLS